MYFGGGVSNIVLEQSFCMAMFVKCVWMCELECWGMVLRSPVYSACGVVLMLRGVGWHGWHGWSGFAQWLRLEIVSLAC